MKIIHGGKSRDTRQTPNTAATVPKPPDPAHRSKSPHHHCAGASIIPICGRVRLYSSTPGAVP
ncbi:hypothetical protein PLICRDRAFT_56621 [Plicaturopsis crispa FD-325 SS-3]|nr:hypothetical protein PLICRDRAFT_56621 [Plicaturopsis crispa FD-325 SS-3]